MRRVMYLYLPSWPIDRLRRNGASPGPGSGPADEGPFATVMAAAGRRLLAAVNPAAAAAGLAAGMPLADALSFFPGLATAAAAPEADTAALGRLAEWCRRYSPWTAPDGTDGIKIETTGCAHLWGGEAPLAADLARRLDRQKVAHRIAIAGTLGTAWALARFAAEPGRPALPDASEEREALAPLPVEALRLDPAIVTGLRRVGLKRIGDLYPMPRDALARRFGEAVALRLDQALGDEPEPLSPLGEAPARRVRLSFAEPIADPADLIRAIERLVGDLAARLAREGIGVRRLDLAFHRVDGAVEHIPVGTARPTRDAKHLAGLLKAKLDTVDPGLGIEDMILALYAADPLEPEQILCRRLAPSGSPGASPRSPPPPLGGGGTALADPPPRRGGGGSCEAWWRERSPDIAPLLDRLGARLGMATLGRLAARESHIPERAAIYAPFGKDGRSDVIPGSPTGRDPEPMNTGLAPTPPFPADGKGSGRGMTKMETTGYAAKPPRPVRLFAPPEPVEATWLLPDDPPFHFTWRRRLHRVQRADGPERIAEEWWTVDVAMTADAIRDYYHVEDAEGRRFWLFRAGLAGNDPPPRWYMHGLFA